jgi:Ca2+-binding EF-hand superfamily protein
MGRLEGDRPHPSFDVDGDGTVSSYDYRLAKLFDADGNGILDEEETKTLREMMAKEKTEAIASMLKATNTRNPDFEKLRKQMVAPPPKEQEHIDGDEAMLMRNAFNAVDSDQSGKIGHEELQKLSVALNVPMSSDEVTQMMKEIDIDDSGEVDFGEFRHYWVQSKKGVAGDVSMFAGIDLGSDEFRIKIDRLAAQARKLNGAYNSQGAVAVMDQSAAINPNVVLPDKIYGERLTKAQYFGTSPPGGSRTSSRATATSGSASGSESPELYQKGTNIFRLVSDKIESKTNNVAKLFRQFDENKDGTVDYRELRVGLANMNVEMTDKEFDHLVELIDEDGDGEIDYQEFANADVMGSRLFKARQISGNSGCTSQSQLAGARFKKNREFADYKISKRYDSYMLGGREGYFGKAPELDQSMVMNGGDEDGDGVVDDFEAMHIREMMSKKKLDKEALVATRTPWAVGYPDDPRTIMTARFQHFVRR